MKVLRVNKTVSGILVLNKPAGISSRQALDRVTHLLPRVKMGHAGTLDPMASGVLVVCLGKATRLIQYVQRMHKEYEATLLLGVRSATHDLESAVLPTRYSVSPDPDEIAPRVDEESFNQCLSQFRGDIMQVPPQHSALHVGGRRAYELARAGQTVELASRPVTIDRCVCTRFAFPEAELDIRCSSGTYVRSMVRDIGESLGTGAVMTRLVRTAVGNFLLSDAVSADSLTAPELLQHLRPIHEALAELAVITVPESQIEDVRHGRVVPWPAAPQAATSEVTLTRSVSEADTSIECAITDAGGEILAVGELDETSRNIHPRIVLVDE